MRFETAAADRPGVIYSDVVEHHGDGGVAKRAAQRSTKSTTPYPFSSLPDRRAALCPPPFAGGYSLGNQWRIAGDGDTWPALTNCFNTAAKLRQYAGPGGWNGGQ